MTQKIKHILAAGAIIAILPTLAMAELPNNAQNKITELCKGAIEKKGYSAYEYKYVEILKAQSGNYSMTGQLHKDAKRFEFNCALNKALKTLKIEELVIEEIK